MVADKQPGSGIANVVVPVLAVVVFFFVFEVSLRVIFHRSMDFDIEMWKYATELKREASIQGLGHEHVPNGQAFLMGVDVKTNAKGLRDRNFDHEKPDNAIRVLMLGDSLAFGWGVDVADTPSKILERALAKTSPETRFEVINTGVGNYNTAMEVAYFLEEGVKYDPDVVVLNYFINDAEETPTRNVNPFLGWSYAYVYLAGRLDALSRQALGGADWMAYYRGLYRDDAPGWRGVKDSVRRLKQECDARGVRLLFANYPEIRVIEPYPFADVTAKIEGLAREQGVPFVDLLPALDGLEASALWVTRPDPHPNATANQAFARGLGDALARVYPELFPSP